MTIARRCWFLIHLLNPLQVTLALLAVWGIQRRVVPWLVRRRCRVAYLLLLPLLLVLSLPTHLYLITWRFVELSRYERPSLLQTDEAAALGWPAQRATRDDVVLCELERGQYVPAETSAQAVLAHWAKTVDVYRTRDDVARA